MSWVIGGIIGVWCLFVIVRRIRKWKRGEFCDCGCSDCAHSCKKNSGRKEQ